MRRCRLCGAPLDGEECLRCGGELARADLLEPPLGGAVAELVAGVRLALRGASLTVRTPRLLALVLIPLAIGLSLFVALVGVVWQHRDLVRPELVTPWPVWIDWLRRVVAFSAEGLGVLAGIGLAFAATVVVAQAINAPFLEGLSQAVETIVVGRSDRTPFSLARLWRTGVVPVFQAIGVAVAQAAIAVALFAVSLLAVTAPLAALGGVWVVALTLCDVAIARKGFPVRERFRRVRSALPMYLGLAFPFFLAPFLLPLGVAGATLADLRLRAYARGS